MGCSAWQFNLLLVSQSLSYLCTLHAHSYFRLTVLNWVQFNCMLHIAGRCTDAWETLSTLWSMPQTPRLLRRNSYICTCVALATPNLNPFLFWQHTKPWPPQRTRKYICKCPRRNHNTIVNSIDMADIPYLAYYTELCTVYSRPAQYMYLLYSRQTMI